MSIQPLSVSEFSAITDSIYYYAGRICTYVALCIFSEARVQLACFQPILDQRCITHFALGALKAFSEYTSLQAFEGREDLNNLIPRVIAATSSLWSEETVGHYTPPPPVRVVSEEELAAIEAARAENEERKVVELIGKIEWQLLNNKNVNEGDIKWYCLLQRLIPPKMYEKLASRLIQEAHGASRKSVFINRLICLTSRLFRNVPTEEGGEVGIPERILCHKKLSYKMACDLCHEIDDFSWFFNVPFTPKRRVFLDAYIGTHPGVIVINPEVFVTDQTIKESPDVILQLAKIVENRDKWHHFLSEKGSFTASAFAGKNSEACQLANEVIVHIIKKQEYLLFKRWQIEALLRDDWQYGRVISVIDQLNFEGLLVYSKSILDIAAYISKHSDEIRGFQFAMRYLSRVIRTLPNDTTPEKLHEYFSRIKLVPFFAFASPEFTIENIREIQLLQWFLLQKNIPNLENNLDLFFNSPLAKLLGLLTPNGQRERTLRFPNHETVELDTLYVNGIHLWTSFTSIRHFQQTLQRYLTTS